MTGIEGTFLDAQYPRPVSGCAAEVSQRIAEAVFAALVAALPDRVTAAPAGTSGNFALGGHDPARGRDFVMYQLSGGGYGGNADHDGLANGCSTIGISKAPPVEIMEQHFPVLYHHYAPARGLGRRRDRIAAASGSTTSWNCAAATRGRASSWITAASARRARSAGRTARRTR